MELGPVVCASCGTANEVGRKFCAECGNRLGVACAVCGTLNPATVKFCGECGSAMHTNGAAAESAAPHAIAESVAERRLVSVMFTDLVGFTTASEGRDAEETRELLTRYFQMATGIIERHGGTVEKFIGDAVMAVWGAPTAHEDDAERAVRAALELIAAVPTLGDAEQPIQARAGVLTGEAAVTLGATNQGLVAGDMVNTASRLQSAAAPGTVLVGEGTYRAASTAISFEPAGAKEMKGKASPVPAWRATAVVARRGGSGRSELLEPPFVGREDELRLLKDLFDATGREGKSRLATIIGQAGIGKSRLAWEFEKYLDGVVDTVYWHEGRSPSYGEGISYWALVEMVRRRAGIAETDGHDVARSKLAQTLDEFVTDPTERRWIEPRMAGLLALQELPTEGREELFAAWRTFFERIAAVAPSIMIFTDLQWADQGMLDFVEDLLHWARSSPILVVAQARPELLERRPDFGGGVRNVTRISLEPLTGGQMRELLEGLVPGLPANVLRQIVERAEGIPLYAVETVRMLLDRELLVAEDGRYRLVGEIPALGVAETLHALIASRLDANRPEDRALLQDASVLGQSFRVEALAAVAGSEPAALKERLDRLVRHQLLVVDEDPRSPERGQYQFVQAVVREVGYASLARADRRTRHLNAARYQESLGDEEAAGVLASHYLAAHEASRPGPEADALAAQARIALQAAADRAAALHSHRQALGYLEQALTVTADPGEQAALHLRATLSGESAGDLDAAMEHARTARDIYRSLADAAGVLQSSTWLGRHQTTARQEPQAIETFEQAIAEGSDIADSPEYATALAELSRVYMLAGRHADAVATADRALELGGRHRLVRPVIEALINKGTALQHFGRQVEASAVLHGAIVLADREQLAMASLRARNNLVGIYQDDDLRATRVLVEEGLDLATRLGHLPFMHQFLMQLTLLSLFMGDWGTWTEQVAVVEEEDVHPYYAAGFAGSRATLAAARGDMALAEVELARGLEFAASLTSAAVSAWQSMTLAYLAFYRGDWLSAATSALDAASASNYDVEGPDLAVHAAAAGNLTGELQRAIDALRASPYQGVGTMAAIAGSEGAQAARQGRWDEARALYRQALELRERTGELLGVALLGLEWGALAGDRDPEASAASAAGEAFFAERGALVTVERYRAAFVPVSHPSAGAKAPARRSAGSASKVPSS
ncbi:MAG: AAA family ATPase [Chloroflexota bacterium]|nr:AAA family ATPase [Chloroflexota bacterium]